jgi:hypothetical protein
LTASRLIFMRTLMLHSSRNTSIGRMR